jgi:pimeloyl-ACP methyl ester carboxylesterase
MSGTEGAALRRPLRRLKNELRGAFAGHLRGPRYRIQGWFVAPIITEMQSSSRTLLIAFGGMRGRIGMPVFEFFSMTRELPVKRMFVRDLRLAWYHRGVRRHGSTLPELANSLHELIAQHEVERLVAIGNSAGGYAALAFGTLLGADRVLAFAPQTVLEPSVLAEWGDHRWNEYLDPLVAAGKLDPRWSDLRVALPRARVADTRYDIYFDNTLRRDRVHAEHLEDLDGVRLYRFGHGRHRLVGALRDVGALDRIVRRAVAPEGDS